ncbi:hypothetical protein [Streptomyces sp. NPDC050485]|uniref:hypothetical protein n=1 Tax=Streptomyces sp. NPDC050485 TaxID=3365617 RepID=UPI00379D3C96
MDPDPGRDDADGIDQYEQLRQDAARGGRARGLAVLTAKGMAAFLAMARAMAPRPRRLAGPAQPMVLAAPLERDIVRIWASMVLAHAP